MARTAAARKDDNTSAPEGEITEAPEGEITEATLVSELPADFAFTVSENVEIPATIAKGPRSDQHPFALQYDNMGHNSSFFVPLAYWLKRGRTVENTPFSKQKDIIGITFQGWKKKDAEARKKWRLVMVARNMGEDAQYPNMTGIRAWKVDTSR